MELQNNFFLTKKIKITFIMKQNEYDTLERKRKT